MELKQLQYFVCVAEQGSFTRAALLLHVGQTTLSRQIRTLEVELRVSLFYRNGRGALLTPEGRRLLDHARGLLHGVDLARQSVHPDADAFTGQVKVGIPHTISLLVVPALVDQVCSNFPQATLSIIEGLSSHLYDQVLAGRLDLAVLRNPIVSPHLSIDPIKMEDLYLVGRTPLGTQSIVTLPELVGLPLIMPNTPHALRPLLESAMARLNSAPNLILEIDSISSLMDLVRAGRGYTISTESTLRALRVESDLSWQPIAAPELRTTLCLVSPSRRPKTPLPLEVMKLARDILVQKLG